LQVATPTCILPPLRRRFPRFCGIWCICCCCACAHDMHLTFFAICKLPFVCGQTNVRRVALVDRTVVHKLCHVRLTLGKGSHIGMVNCMPHHSKPYHPTLPLPVKFKDKPVHVGCELWLPPPPFFQSLLLDIPLQSRGLAAATAHAGKAENRRKISNCGF